MVALLLLATVLLLAIGSRTTGGFMQRLALAAACLGAAGAAWSVLPQI